VPLAQGAREQRSYCAVGHGPVHEPQLGLPEVGLDDLGMQDKWRLFSHRQLDIEQVSGGAAGRGLAQDGLATPHATQEMA